LRPRRSVDVRGAARIDVDVGRLAGLDVDRLGHGVTELLVGEAHIVASRAQDDRLGAGPEHLAVLGDLQQDRRRDRGEPGEELHVDRHRLAGLDAQCPLRGDVVADHREHVTSGRHRLERQRRLAGGLAVDQYPRPRRVGRDGHAPGVFRHGLHGRVDRCRRRRGLDHLVEQRLNRRRLEGLGHAVHADDQHDAGGNEFPGDGPRGFAAGVRDVRLDRRERFGLALPAGLDARRGRRDGDRLAVLEPDRRRGDGDRRRRRGGRQRHRRRLDRGHGRDLDGGRLGRQRRRPRAGLRRRVVDRIGARRVRALRLRVGCDRLERVGAVGRDEPAARARRLRGGHALALATLGLLPLALLALGFEPFTLLAFGLLALGLLTLAFLALGFEALLLAPFRLGTLALDALALLALGFFALLELGLALALLAFGFEPLLFAPLGFLALLALGFEAFTLLALGLFALFALGFLTFALLALGLLALLALRFLTLALLLLGFQALAFLALGLEALPLLALRFEAFLALGLEALPLLALRFEAFAFLL